jgi:shikimate kinase
MPKIILVGYMASGKSSIARELGVILGYPVVDLDHYIEQKKGMSVSEIFARDGEVRFRKFESRMFDEVLAQPGNAVLSLGGGTPCYAGNHLKLTGDDRISFYLQTSVGEIVRRLESVGTGRPLVDGMSGDELREFVAKHLFDRNPFYRHASHVVTTDRKSVPEIAREIAALAQVG